MANDPYRGDNTTGFQSPAQDFIEPVIDLAHILDLRRPSYYPVRVKGDGLREQGIHAGDVLIANAAAEPQSKVCIAFLNKEVILVILGQKQGVWVVEPGQGLSHTH